MSEVLSKYRGLFSDIRKLVAKSKREVLRGAPSGLIATNVNFFTKSYLIMICVYLEAYIKEIAQQYIAYCNDRLGAADIPRNLVLWSIKPSEKIKPALSKFEPYGLSISKESLDNLVSANPFRTKEMFMHLGIDLDNKKAIKQRYELVGQIVRKRNDIIHYNDTASDVSLDDVLNYISLFRYYMKAVDDVVCACMLK